MSKSTELQADLGLDFEAIDVACQDPDAMSDEELGAEAAAWLPILARAAVDPENITPGQLGVLARSVLPELTRAFRLASLAEAREQVTQADAHP